MLFIDCVLLSPSAVAFLTKFSDSVYFELLHSAWKR